MCRLVNVLQYCSYWMRRSTAEKRREKPSLWLAGGKRTTTTTTFLFKSRCQVLFSFNFQQTFNPCTIFTLLKQSHWGWNNSVKHLQVFTCTLTPSGLFAGTIITSHLKEAHPGLQTKWFTSKRASGLTVFVVIMGILH